ncbi:alpha/beta fold hydrolase [Nocardiopsis exhalans]|uniref:Alpha/beta fold hydrolase n=1 Tax=Nocardiopsis exhalans TaxID=163604 RepID=A0ABY5CYY4_9ACTN|nr:alpha/beta fold hydrolase [Nocardiopsis exhalans]USY17011.1 alpha/beta fold hydrolase [Nocardiopsis exhalans]
MSAIYRTEAAGLRLQERYRRDLTQVPVPAEHLRVPTREGETFVLACGAEQAPPLVLLHGSGANSTTWFADLPGWSRHFRVYSVDLIGEPGLSAPSRPDLSTEASTLWLDEVLDALGVDSAALVGLSLGGWTALDYTIRRPERVTRLALLCPGGVGPQRRWRLLGAGLLMLFGRGGKRMSTRLMTGLNRPEDQSVLDAVVQNFGQFRPRTETLPVFSDDALRGLELPIQVSVGERDRMFDSARTARRFVECVPHAQVRVLRGVGHAVMGQTEPVLEFLRG